jgi:hypothetical protein
MIMTWTGTRIGRGLRKDVDKNFEKQGHERTRKRTTKELGEGLRKDQDKD